VSNNKDSAAVNADLLRQLNSGATAIAIHANTPDLNTALRDVQLNFIKSTFYADAGQLDHLASYLRQHYDMGQLHCAVFPERLSSENDLSDWLSASEKLNSPTIKTNCFDALYFHNLNCYAYYEIAVILSGLNEFLNALNSKKIKPAADFVVKTGVSSDYFLQIAKLRAIRRLWNVLKAEYQLQNDLYLITETSGTNKSVSDNYNNLLRTTVESMAAVCGGCNELVVTPFDSLFAVNQSLSERMALNQQLILKDESYLDKIADVGCGSYYIEAVTDALATKALETLKRFETEGGYFACLEKNIFTNEIRIQSEQKAELIRSQKQVAIGVNKFKNEKETIVLPPTVKETLKQMGAQNPVLNFELENIFK
jgi:methylmalonyl-CoA mutase